MQYQISHETTYDYSAPVLQSYHVLHLAPRPIENQIIHSHNITIQPTPKIRDDCLDYFGNPKTLFYLEEKHSKLIVRSECAVDVLPAPRPDIGATSPWNDVPEAVRTAATSEAGRVTEFMVPSRHVRLSQQLLDYAKPSFSDRRPILECVSDLTRRIFDDFTFDNTATDVSTPVEEVLATRRGVCQDFAHLQISALRCLGIPSKYVSGYIVTHPPKGQPKLQGADASHAWVSVWTPELGWVDFDPTNNLIPSQEHIAIASGRDYEDVSPISGVLLGGGTHVVHVSVDVAPRS